MILGLLAHKDDVIRIHQAVKTLLFEKKMKLKIKTGAMELKYGADINSILPFFVETMEKMPEEISFFPSDTIYLSGQKTKSAENGISSLYLDAEDRICELLTAMEKLKNQEQKIKNVYFELINSLVAALESKDPYTTGHSQRVCKYAVALAEKLNLSAGEIERIRKAALLHDLGKIGIPDGILHKKGKLNDDEFSIIKEHEVISAKILEPLEEFKDIIPDILHHHERFDGTGYPHGLAGTMIPLGARIISLADVFDALVTGRDYKNAFPIPDAVGEIEKNKGKQFDPALADAFIQTLKDAKIL